VDGVQLEVVAALGQGLVASGAGARMAFDVSDAGGDLAVAAGSSWERSAKP